jgi:hypothetical protein
MPTQTKVKTSLSNSSALAEQVGLLRSAVISVIGKDKEGEYRPEFIRKLLAASAETAEYKFTSPEAFLKDLD